MVFFVALFSDKICDICIPINNYHCYGIILEILSTLLLLFSLDQILFFEWKSGLRYSC